VTVDAREQHPAGMKDRISMMTMLLNLAVQTCGRLAFKPPCEALKAAHNHNTRVACDLTWRDYVILTHDELVSTTPPQPGENVIDAARGYHWPCTRDPRPRVVDHQIAPRLLALADSAILAAGLPPRFLGLHLRRTDALRKCDSSPPRVVAKVAAALQGAQLPVAFWTDEQGHEYTGQISTALESIVNVTSVTHMDPLIAKLPLVRNNYDVFLIEMTLAQRATVQVEFSKEGNC
jgi:hypothetical protein